MPGYSLCPETVPPLLAWSFFQTDHELLQWLSAQKMEGMLCHWALAMQEFYFSIEYRKGSVNSNADALSRRETSQHTSAATQIQITESKEELQEAQQTDSNIHKKSC